MKNRVLIEICANSIESALAAQNGGADRIELCDNLQEGGTTPSYGIIKKTVDNLKIPVFVLIRPRGGDFLYTNSEFEALCLDIEMAKKAGAAGIVSGCLTANGKIDKQRTAKIVELANPLPVTFHRAFDLCFEPFKSLQTLIFLGVKRILTSGFESNALKGADAIGELIKLSGSQITIMPGGGINTANVMHLLQETKAKEIHLTAKSIVQSNMVYRKDNVKMGTTNELSEYEWIMSDVNKIKEMVSIVNEF